jgi:hypothetical protein
MVDCKRMADLMVELGHDHIDILKLDIEGSWYEVLQDILASKLSISVICVEFDTPTTIARVLRTITALGESEFIPIHRQRDNWTFMHKRLFSHSSLSSLVQSAHSMPSMADRRSAALSS